MSGHSMAGTATGGTGGGGTGSGGVIPASGLDGKLLKWDATAQAFVDGSGNVVAPPAAGLNGKPLKWNNATGLFEDATSLIGVTSWGGRTGSVTPTKSDVGLSFVDNTSDLDKPLSTAAKALFDAANLEPILIPARAIGATGAGISNGTAGGGADWTVTLPATGTTRATVSVRLPSAWTTVKVTWEIVAPDSTALNYRLQFESGSVAPASTRALGSALTAFTVVAPSPAGKTQDVVTPASGSVTGWVSGQRRFSCALVRLGDDAADTHAGLLHIASCLIEPV